MTAAPYRLSSDHADMQIDAIHDFLSTSYWAAGIPYQTVARAVANSVCVGAFQGRAQIGFARVISDRATFAYLADVYVLAAYCGQGLARAMVQRLQDHSDLQGLRRWILFTRDAHSVYAPLGWSSLPDPARLMRRDFPDVYSGATS
ncbi:MAG: GNAT family N-acetyltransferase [Sphingomonas bacterium]